MIAWRLWVHMRLRVAVALLVVLLNSAVLIGVARLARPALLRDSVPTWIDLTPEDREQLLSETASPTALVERYWLDDAVWLFPAIAVLLGLGGVATTAWPDSRDLTLSLGTSRASWILRHAMLSVGIVAVLAAVSMALVIAGTASLGEAYPAARAAVRVVQITAASAAWIALALGIALLTRKAIPGALVCGAILVLTQFVPVLREWSPWVIPNPDSWIAGPPWPAIIASVLLAAGGLGMAVSRRGAWRDD